MYQEGARQPLTGEARLEAYLDAITGELGHARRAASARAYCTGLLLPGERKSIEPMAARLDPAHVQAKHQSLHHVVAQADWDDAALLAAVRAQVLPAIERHGPVAYWIVDDSGFPKQGTHSVGVARQYCGQLGKQDNCQVAVSLSVANDYASLPIAYQLFLPEVWANDQPRRDKAGVPAAIRFETKTAIALGQLRRALAAGVPVGIVLGDPAYGDETDFRVGVADLGLRYLLGVRSGTSVWAPDTGPLPPLPWSGRGRRPTRLRRDAENQPVTLKALALSLPAEAWRSVTWREGTNGELTSRFAAVRVRPAHRDTQRSEPWPEEWLLIEWPDGDAAPAKDWFSNLSRRATLKRLVRIAKARWWIERDYQELKQELGLGDFEGRNWRGFHHHASLCIAAYGFLIAERCLFPPQRQFIRRRIETPALPAGFQPRGAASAA
ncbi:MAG TPA: IS701 family transposase [Streptosporangiaceae bacterium]|nr:IS701 family transposase [Streptosporangiaceae bacterium]